MIYRNLRRILCLSLSALMTALLFGCSGISKPADITPNPVPDDTSEPASSDGPDNSPVSPDSVTPEETPAPEESKEPWELEIKSKLPLDLSEVGAAAASSGNVDLLYEAEDSRLEGITRADSSQAGFTGSGYVTDFKNPGQDKVIFEVSVPVSSYYDLTFVSAAPYGEKFNNIIIDGNFLGQLPSKDSDFVPYTFKQVFLEEGSHEITVEHSWGWFLLDSLKITSAEAFDTGAFYVEPVLINKNANDVTRRLMKFLTDIYGKYIISGQYSETAFTSREFTVIRMETGRYPAMAGLDLIDYTPSRTEFGAQGKSVEAAIDWWNRGGLVTFCWHWNAPTKYLPNTSENPWWSGFYTRATNIDIEKIMNGQDEEGYNLLLADIDAIAVQLKRLQDAGVPVLWRPLHEASGGWFWWGSQGSEPYKKLWKLLYERLTDMHELNNLIWVWNGQAADWYPGDEYVDIIGEDIYPGERQYGSQFGKFSEALDYSSSNKIIALTENGCLFDPDLAFRDNARWAWFATWQKDFVIKDNGKLSEQYTERSMLQKVYEHERVLNLIDIPDIETYPLD